jgi:hypothetical protein
MTRFIIALCLLFTAHEANAACGSTANRAGCNTPNGAVAVGPNGVATANKNTGTVKTFNRNSGGGYSTQSNKNYPTNQVAPGTTVQGRRGNNATKAVQQGCAFVNGQRVCR